MMIKRSAKILFLSAALPLYLLGSEPSAFGAGDLTSDSPYGLTSDEKVLLETKKKLKTVDIHTKTQASKLDSLRERMDGLQDVLEALSRKSHANKIALQELKKEFQKNVTTNDEYQKRLSQIVQESATAVQENEKKIKLLQTSLLEMSKVIDTINENYVSKSEFNAVVTDINNFKVLMAKELRTLHASPKKKAKKRSGAELYNSAKRNFDKKRYTQAIEEYKALIQRKYKPAYAHYMLGEIYYKRKDYAKAISYFKKSAKLYSKASYMPRLMLHTAIAMEKTGDIKHAKAFYNAIIKKYPSSKEAKEAKKRLN